MLEEQNSLPVQPFQPLEQQPPVLSPKPSVRQIWTDLKMRFTHRVRRAHSRFNQLSPAEKRLRIYKWLRFLALVGLGLVILGVIAFFILFAYFSRQLPKPGEIVRQDGYSTRIFDRNGKLLYDLYDDKRRVPVKITEIPKTLQEATVSIEDKDFYKHQGFDILTILRIPYYYVTEHRVVGGSTLTQQLVKNVLLTNDRSVIRKFKELVLAIQIERTFTKDQILEMYLNEAPYGGAAAGVGVASEMYFNKPVSQLNLVESAILAGLPQRPTAYSPYSGQTTDDGEPLWKFRGKGVLRRMHEDGYITDDQYNQALKDIEAETFQRAATDIKAAHFVMYIRQKLIDMYGEDVAIRGGLSVTTTLDLDIQQDAEQIVSEEIGKVKNLHITNGAAMITDPQTGQILGMIGSKGYFADDIDGQFNVAVDGLRQPGSSIKPVTYLAMFQRGFTPASMLVDANTVFAANTTDKPYQPQNYDGKFHGPMSLRSALGNSMNVPAVKSMATVGIDHFLQLAYDMGFGTLEPSTANKQRFGLSLTLGGGEVHLIDTVTAYSAFANGGRKVEPVSILKITDKDGKTIYADHPVQGPQVIKPEEAFLIDSVLSDNNARAIEFGLNSQLNTGKPIAVKTGTTNEQKDNWTIGWSQNIMVGVWVGNNDNTSMTRVASGITGAAPIWHRIIMDAISKGYKTPDFVPPSNVHQVDVDSISGYPAHDNFPTNKEYVIDGTLPQGPDPIHTNLKLCPGDNKLANTAAIAAGNFTSQEFIVLKEDDPVSKDGTNRWQQGIDGWIGGQTDARYKPPTDYCGDQSDVFISLKQPADQTKYDSEDIPVEVEADADAGINKIEVYIDSALRETVNDRHYQQTLHMPSGQHSVYAIAYAKSGKSIQSGTAHIGTGGQDWQQPTPTPSPSPSPSP